MLQYNWIVQVRDNRMRIAIMAVDLLPGESTLYLIIQLCKPRFIKYFAWESFQRFFHSIIHGF